VLSPVVLFIHYFVASGYQELTFIDITTSQWCKCIVVGLVAFSAVSFTTIGFQLEEAPRGSVIMYFEIPFMYIAQWVIFGEGISSTELLGVLFMITGSLGPMVEKIIMIKREEQASNDIFIV